MDRYLTSEEIYVKIWKMSANEDIRTVLVHVSNLRMRLKQFTHNSDICIHRSGAQGAVVFGTQGAGVNKTGSGRFVAGLTTLLHMPKGIMFALGLLSIIVAIGPLAIMVVCAFVFRVAGAVPKVHCKFAPIHTPIAIVFLPS